jgi:hypothetical protein
MIERLWITLSGVLLVVAAGCLWWNNLPAAFVTAALGACAWFLSYRTQLRKKIKDDDASEEDSAGHIDHE